MGQRSRALMTAPWALASPSLLFALVASLRRGQGEARYAPGSTLGGARKAGINQRNIGLAGGAGRVGGLFSEDDARQ